MLRLLYVLVLAYAVSACSGATEHQHDHTHAGGENHVHDHEHGDAHDHQNHKHSQGQQVGAAWGKEISREGGMDVDAVLAKVQEGEETVEYDLGEGNTVDAVPAKIKGKVIEVCQAAGCWLTVQASDGTELFVDTKHKFFFPTDITGKTVVLEGKAYRSVQTVEELRHFAEDAGKTEEEIAKITEPKNNYTFLAEGAVLVD